MNPRERLISPHSLFSFKFVLSTSSKSQPPIAAIMNTVAATVHGWSILCFGSCAWLLTHRLHPRVSPPNHWWRPSFFFIHAQRNLTQHPHSKVWSILFIFFAFLGDVCWFFCGYFQFLHKTMPFFFFGFCQVWNNLGRFWVFWVDLMIFVNAKEH